MINEESFRNHFSHFDKDIVVEIIDIFIEEYDDRMEKISGFIAKHDLEALRKAAHAFKGVIGNFETDCKAYQHIEAIENETRDLIEEVNNGRVLSEEEENEFYHDLLQHFAAFRKSSFELLNDLKEIRKEYVEEKA